MIKIYTGYKGLTQLYTNQNELYLRCITYLFTKVQIKVMKYELNIQAQLYKSTYQNKF